ncbi:MAG: hypothetical protein QOH25_647 [Acidobacteriota bacterium]|nr:hypothetical protein [Acidobacteriota bacterium]
MTIPRHLSLFGHLNSSECSPLHHFNSRKPTYTQSEEDRTIDWEIGGKAFATGSAEQQDNPEDRRQAIKQLTTRQVTSHETQDQNY